MIYYTWEQFSKDVKLLVRRVKYAKVQPKSIIGIARGGLVLGVALSHKLKAPLTIISTSSYQSKQKLDTIVFNTSFCRPLENPVLVVDDICDSGRTLDLVLTHVKTFGFDVYSAVLFYKEASYIKPTWYLHKINKSEQWVKFPWE